MLRRSYINNHKDHSHYISDTKILNLQKRFNFSSKEEELLNIVRNLSDSTKLRIYLLLHRVEEISVTDLTLVLEMSQSAISHALSDLKKLELVESHRCGQLICYSLKKGRKKKLLGFFEKFA